MVDRLQTLAQALLLANRRSRLLLAGLSGLIAALALQPLDWLPALFVAMPVLVWLIDAIVATEPTWRARFGQLAVTGWVFGFSYFVAGLWWLGVAFVTGGEQFIWLMPLGVVGLPIILALFTAFGVMLAGLFWSRSAWRIAALTLGLGGSEWLRSWLFTGFPWNSWGQMLASHLVLSQGVAVIGASGMGLWLVFVASSAATLATGQTRLGRWGMPAFAAMLMAGALGYGFARLGPTGGPGVDFTRLPLVPDIRLRVMQPNIAQDAKTFEMLGPDLLRRYLELSDAARGAHATGIANVTHLFWPESPFPFVLERNAEALAAIGRFLPAQTHLITGAIRAEETGQDRPRFRYFNAMQVLDKSGIIAGYDKVHLVPFGEYLPFEPVLRAIGLEQFVSVIGGFTASPARRPLSIPGLPGVLPLICFEAIFPAELTVPPGSAQAMVVVTNDGWFGQTSGPYQHFAQARLRAVEFGVPMIRAANTGISAIIDPYGRILAQIGLGVTDVLDSPLPKGLVSTAYRRYGESSFLSLMFCLLLLSGFARVWDRKGGPL
jgi:apolipoprotein N-acyltransferase